MSASRKVSVWLLIILLPAVAYLGWYNYRQFTRGEEELAGVVEKPKWRFANEENWLVDETVRDIAELLAYAKNPTGKVDVSAEPKKGAAHSYNLKIMLDGKSTAQTFETREYIWSPGDYAPVARKLMGEWKLAPTASSPSPAEFLAALADGTPQTLIKESKRLSEALTKTPLDPALHEQAAMVTAAFALHEAAEEFSDSRREFCRVAAHLAIARALQPQATGPVHALAEATLQTLAGRETPALRALDALPTDAPGVLSWTRALRLYNTGDWRQEIDPSVPLEQVEAFRARAKSGNSHFAILWLEKQKPAPLHDFRRIVLENSFGVEDGHRFAKESLAQEMAALQADWTVFVGNALSEKEAIKALTEPAGRAVTMGTDGRPAIDVLGWAFWSAQHQRHLCASIRATNDFLRDDWGVPEFRELQKFAKLNFPDLAVFPLIERDLSEDAHDIKATSERVKSLITKHPELVTASLWQGSCRPCGKNIPALDIPRPEAWFDPVIPFGTVYIFDRAANFPLPHGKDPWWSAFVALAPSNYRVRFGQTWMAYGGHPSAEAAETGYGPLGEYHLKALEMIAEAQKNVPAKYPVTMEKLCALDPDNYWTLGKWYLSQNNPEKAAEAYRKGVDLGEDRVQAANNCGWLVNYLDDHGQPEKALAIATEAAEVYSSQGLETMGRLREKHGQLDAALDYFKKIAERYDDPEALNGFYMRNQDKNPEYKEAAARLIRDIFPGGLEKVALAEFKGPPEDGVVLTSGSGSATAAGVYMGDVIVAIDGYHVHNEKQYMCARALSDDPKFQLIVWNARGYREIAANVPGRRFNVDLGDYHRK